MHPIGKTLWYIETHLSDESTVERLSDVAKVSSYHLVRSFGAVTGLPLMHYVRYRRLSKAAVELSTSDLRILDIAMNAGYNSHEAFTRAFVASFGVPPETLRSANSLQEIKLVEPIKMNDMPF
jgi:AraC family transcriptional regulator